MEFVVIRQHCFFPQCTCAISGAPLLLVPLFLCRSNRAVNVDYLHGACKISNGPSQRKWTWAQSCRRMSQQYVFSSAVWSTGSIMFYHFCAKYLFCKRTSGEQLQTTDFKSSALTRNTIIVDGKKPCFLPLYWPVLQIKVGAWVHHQVQMMSGENFFFNWLCCSRSWRQPNVISHACLSQSTKLFMADMIIDIRALFITEFLSGTWIMRHASPVNTFWCHVPRPRCGWQLTCLF